MTAPPSHHSAQPAPFAIAAALVAASALVTAPSVAAQSAPTESAVRDFLENSVLEMRLGEGSWIPFPTDTIEFQPAATIMPGGGIVVTQRVAESASMGMPYEPWRWSLREAGGVLSLRLMGGGGADGGPEITLESPLATFDGGQLNIELRGSVHFNDEIEDILVEASLMALDRLGSDARRQQRESLAGAWVLHRIGDMAVAGPGIPPVTYDFATDGTFAVEAADGSTSHAAPVLETETLQGHWLITGRAWTRPPLEGDYEHGALLMLYGGGAGESAGEVGGAPDVFMILEQDSDALAIKRLAPWPLAEGLAWITLHLRR